MRTAIGHSDRTMTEEIAFNLAIGIAAVCGALAGRIFAVEAEDRRTAVLAAAYCGGGAGLVSGPAFAFLLVLIAAILDGQSAASVLARAGQATGPALLWGIAAGAGGGFAVGALVAIFKRSAPH
jgi:hypothetical protein